MRNSTFEEVIKEYNKESNNRVKNIKQLLHDHKVKSRVHTYHLVITIPQNTTHLYHINAPLHSEYMIFYIFLNHIIIDIMLHFKHLYIML